MTEWLMKPLGCLGGVLPNSIAQELKGGNITMADLNNPTTETGGSDGNGKGGGKK